jgi:hypothetical protein
MSRWKRKVLKQRLKVLLLSNMIVDYSLLPCILLCRFRHCLFSIQCIYKYPFPSNIKTFLCPWVIQILEWPCHLFRNIVSQYSSGSAVPNVAFITGIDVCQLKIPQANYKESERIYWLVLLQFRSVQII